MASPSPAPGTAEPVDRARLTRLRDEVGAGTARRFAETFLDLLASRVERIAAPPQDDPSDALRAAFDLRVGSQMLGAARLAGVASGVERSFRDGTAPDAGLTASLRIEARLVARVLPGMLGLLDE